MAGTKNKEAAMETARTRLIEITNSNFGLWLEGFAQSQPNCKIDEESKKLTLNDGTIITFEEFIDVWTILSKLVVESVDRGRHLNRKEVASLLNASPATNRRRLELCDKLGFVELYTPSEVPNGKDRRSEYCRPTKLAIDLVDRQLKQWTIRFGSIIDAIKDYYSIGNCS